VKTERALHEKPFTVWDLLMLFGGLAFGSSAGAAIGGITFDSDGWHFSYAFWIMLFVATTAAFAVGKTLFTRIVAVRMIDSINIYPYLAIDKDKEIKRKKASMQALFLLVGIFGTFMATDFYGWWRAVTEQNAAFAGDQGALVLNPACAGIAVMFITVLLAGAKFASLLTLASKQRDALLHEVSVNTVTYQDDCDRYEEEKEEYDRCRAAAIDYDLKVQQAHGNARLRCSRESTEVASQIEEYRRSLDTNVGTTVGAEELRRQRDQIVADANARMQAALVPLGDIERRINGIYDRLGSV